jgi:hypothetical protein
MGRTNFLLRSRCKFMNAGSCHFHKKIELVWLIFCLCLVPAPGSADVFPDTEGGFNSLQITYFVNGAQISNATDVWDFTTTRTLEGSLTGARRLAATGVCTRLSSAPGYPSDCRVTVRAGDKTEQWETRFEGPSGTVTSANFDVAVDVPPGAQSGSIEIAMIGHYNVGTRGLVVRGTFTGGVGDKPDLSVTSVTGPTSGTPGNTIDIAATVENTGAIASTAFDMEFLLSSDKIVDDQDWFFAHCGIDALEAGKSSTCSGAATVPAGIPAGTYYLGAYADSQDVVTETSEDNNIQWAAKAIGIGIDSNVCNLPYICPWSIDTPMGSSLSVGQEVVFSVDAGLNEWLASNRQCQAGEVNTYWNFGDGQTSAGLGNTRVRHTYDYSDDVLVSSVLQITFDYAAPTAECWVEKFVTITEASVVSPQSYSHKVRAYFYGVLGRAPDAEEHDTWSRVLFDNKGSVWKPAGAGLQHYLSDWMDWGTTPPDGDTAWLIVDQVFSNLFGWSWDIDSRITNYYVEALVRGSVRPRGLINAILNDLAIMPRVDGTYGQPNGWTGGGSIRGFLTSDQLARYRERIESL